METLYVVEEEPYAAWLADIRYWEMRDPKGSEGVEYLRCREACTAFTGRVNEVSASEDMQLSEVISRATGKPPRNYGKDEIVHLAILPDG